MMKQMRENTKWIMLVTALAFVALMVFQWGMDVSGRSSGAITGGQLGEVNGDPITYQQFNLAYRNLYEQQQQQGSGAMSEEDNRAVEDQAWDQLVMDRLIEQELARRGIKVTDSEIRQAARVAPPPQFYQAPLFQTDGQFDLEKYHRFLASASDKQLLLDLESYYRRIIPRNKLFQQVAASVVVTDGELWQQYREQNETASMDFVLLDPQRLVTDAEVTVTDADITSYYSEHRSDFERPARAEVRVVAVDQAPTAADTAASLERARQVRSEIVDEGADFADVAMQESDDEATAQQGGSLGTIQRGQTVPAFDQAVWSAPIGQVTEPVRSQLGYHIIRVDRRTEDEADVSQILINIQRTLESEDSMLAKVDSLESMVERVSLEAAAEDLGLSVRTTELTPVLPSLPGVGSVSDGVHWVFEQNPLAGAVSPVFENDRYYYVMELVEKDEARPLTLEEATPTIRAILRADRKRGRTREMGRQLVERIQAGATLEAAAAEAGLSVRSAGPFTRLDFVPGVGSGNAAIGAAFGLPVGQVSGLLETESAFYVIRVTDRTEADREAWRAQLPQQRRQVVQALQSQRLNQFLDALRENATIVDNRDQVLTSSGANQTTS